MVSPAIRPQIGAELDACPSSHQLQGKRMSFIHRTLGTSSAAFELSPAAAESEGWNPLDG